MEETLRLREQYLNSKATASSKMGHVYQETKRKKRRETPATQRKSTYLGDIGVLIGCPRQLRQGLGNNAEIH